jgi:hypothetical protein
MASNLASPFNPFNAILLVDDGDVDGTDDDGNPTISSLLLFCFCFFARERRRDAFDDDINPIPQIDVSNDANIKMEL